MQMHIVNDEIHNIMIATYTMYMLFQVPYHTITSSCMLLYNDSEDLHVLNNKQLLKSWLMHAFYGVGAHKVSLIMHFCIAESSNEHA